MSNQIVISSGAKVRSLEGVLTGTAGIVNSVPLGGANGVATLDSMGKVPLSQLPASVVTYLGTWNAATNTPTLTNGVGDVGDLYICNVAGTVNFGAGPITFAVGDWVIYSGTEWQKSSGASGTVTSVAVTESGDALTITGSPITTSGTINIGFAGTGSQYIKGDGTLATFPTTIDQAKRLITEVYNSTGATLSKGTVVYINGGQGNLPTVTKAQANADNTSAQTYGVVQSDITNMNNGFVVVFGSLTNLDTQAYAVGTQLYLSGTTAGAWTSTKPSAPIHLVYVGIVVRSHPTQGVVEIRIQNGYELEELHDVAISSPVNNQGIFYNSSTDLWENKSIATALGYTPANDALVVHLAGTETITGSKIFSAAITADAGISLKEGVVPSAVGYTGLAGDADGLLITKKIGTTAYTNLFYFQAIDASNTYTYPNLSGTLALLEGTQTFSGAKTFSTFPTTFDAESIFNLGFQIKKITTGVSASAGYMAMYAPVGTANKIAFLDGDSTRVSTLTFDTTGSFSYTFPASSGTLALTSNLSSYVPYTGATTNVDLGSNFLKARTFYSEGSGGGGSYAIKNGTTPSFEDGYTILSSNDYRLNIVSTVSAATKAVYFGFSGVTATRTYTLPDASGTLALTSNLSSYVPYTGATADVNLGNTYSLSANNITSAGVLKSDFGLQLKSGLTTTVSGYLSISAQKISTNSQLNVYTDTGFYFSLIAPNTANYSYTFPASNGTIVLGTGTTNYLPKFTGASTIGNSLIFDNGTSVGVGTATPFGTFNVVAGTNKSLIIQDSGISDTIEIASYSTSGGTRAIAMNGSVLTFGTGTAGGGSATARLTINATGNVGIGTSSPFAKFSVGSPSGIGSFPSYSTTDQASIGWNYWTSAAEGYTRYMDVVAMGAPDGTYGGSVIRFLTNGITNGSTPTERMRITSDGKALFGTSTAGYGLFSTQRVTINPISDGIVVGPLPQNNSAYTTQAGDNTGTRYALYIANGSSSNVGSISFTSATTSYNITSDYRLKQDLKEFNGLSILSKVKTYDFEWKIDNSRMYGVIAHELQDVIPYAVLGEKDGEQMQSVDYSKLVPVLVKAIQELKAEIDELKNK